eukprot:211800-Chlamydomonas_euryale.AAC.1
MHARTRGRQKGSSRRGRRSQSPGSKRRRQQRRYKRRACGVEASMWRGGEHNVEASVDWMPVWCGHNRGMGHCVGRDQGMGAAAPGS